MVELTQFFRAATMKSDMPNARDPPRKKRPVFSVITPVFNGTRFVHRCYSTLKAQTFHDWEWVVVDDGSTDGTANAVREIDDSRIKLISYSPNRGQPGGVWLVLSIRILSSCAVMPGGAGSDMSPFTGTSGLSAD